MYAISATCQEPPQAVVAHGQQLVRGHGDGVKTIVRTHVVGQDTVIGLGIHLPVLVGQLVVGIEELSCPQNCGAVDLLFAGDQPLPVVEGVDVVNGSVGSRLLRPVHLPVGGVGVGGGTCCLGQLSLVAISIGDLGFARGGVVGLLFVGDQPSTKSML